MPGFSASTSNAGEEEECFSELVPLQPEGLGACETIFPTAQGRGRKLVTEDSKPVGPVSLFVECEINNITGTERSEARRVATLHTEVCRLRVSATWRAACSHALPCRAPRRHDQEHMRTPTRHPSPKNHALSRLPFPPLFSLGDGFSLSIVLHVC